MAKPHLAELCRAHFPRPVVLVMWVLMEGVAMATDLAEFLGADLPAEHAEPFRLSQPITAVDRPPVITKS